MKGIAVLGTIIVDQINTIAQYPALGELESITSVEKAVGGLVPNDSVDIKRIDPSIPVYAVGKTGDDADAEYVLDYLTRNGVNVGQVKKDSLPTSFTQVMSIGGGERTFFSYPGANDTFGYDDVDWDGLDVDAIHLGYLMLLRKVDEGDGERILAEAKRRGIKTSIDLVSAKGGDYSVVVPCLKYVDNLIINEIEAGGILGNGFGDDLRSTCVALKNIGVSERVVIHSADKAGLYDGKEYIELNSLDVPSEDIKGKTGAGDAFCSGVLVGILNGEDNRSILDFAIRCAAQSLSSAGATEGMTSRDEIILNTAKYKRK